MSIKTFFRVGITGVRFLLYRIIYGKKFNCTWLNSCHHSFILDMDHSGKITIGNHLSANRGLELSVRNRGNLKIGKNVNFNRDCLVVCRGNTSVGNDVIFGPGCKIFDHDHDYRMIGKERRLSSVSGDVMIGDGVWFGANCIILKNTTIGNNCVFGAGSVISGQYEENSIIIQKKDEYIRKITMKLVER